MFRLVLTFILNLITSHSANDHVVRNIVLLAKTLVFSGITTKVMGVGANLTPLVEVGDLSVHSRGNTAPRMCRRRGFGSGVEP